MNDLDNCEKVNLGFKVEALIYFKLEIDMAIGAPSVRISYV